ncbi:hypothetical protein OF83DRAFT_727508 [Amylostereum chailletii]|nr:hypothetical protein OF83DRAFT_727508 [Amylostereum chailletii]
MDPPLLAYRCLAVFLFIITALAGVEVWLTAWYPSPANPLWTEWQMCGYMDLWSLTWIASLNAALLALFEMLAFRTPPASSPRIKYVFCVPPSWLLVGATMFYHGGCDCQRAAPNVWKRAVGHLGSGMLGVVVFLAVVAYIQLRHRPGHEIGYETVTPGDSLSIRDVKVENVKA